MNQDYVNYAGSYPLLTAEEEIELGKKSIKGDKEARDTLVQHNLRLVVHYASKYSNDDAFEDLVQEGNVGLIKAAEKFDPGKGCRFSTYATFWIRQYMLRYLNCNRIVYLTENILIKDRAIRRAQEELREALGRDPLESEVASEIEEDIKTVRAVSQVTQHPVSLEREIVEDFSLIDVLEADNDDIKEEIDVKLMQEHSKELISQLAEREKEVISMRFGIEHYPHTLEEAGELLGISRERIRQIEKKALEEMRKHTKNYILT